jgi:hypothetical protein
MSGAFFNIHDIKMNLDKKNHGYALMCVSEGKKSLDKDKNNVDLLSTESFDLKEQLNSVFSETKIDKYL